MTEGGGSHALLIAVDEYLNFEPLSHAAKGAYSLADLLKNGFGYQTDILIDGHATRTAILDWLEARRNAPLDRLLIYFSGHSLLRESHSRSYLALQSTHWNRYNSALRLDELVDEASSLRTQHILFLVDAPLGIMTLDCFLPHAAPDGMTEAEYMDRRVRYVISAGSDRSNVRSEPSPYSAFTNYLLAGLHGAAADPESGFLSANRLAAYIRNRMQTDQSQQPLFYGHLTGSDRQGDFIFQTHATSTGETRGLPCKIFDPNHLLDEHQHNLLRYLRIANNLTVLDHVTSGQSGSAVFHVAVQSNIDSGPKGIHFCKIYRSTSGHERDVHEQVWQTKLQPYVPKITDTTPIIKGWMATLYSPAHARAFHQPQALADLLAIDLDAAHRNLKELLKVIVDWNQPLRYGYSRLDDLIAMPLNRYQPEAVSQTIGEFIQGLDDSKTQLQFLNQVLPNPVAYLVRPELWKISGNIAWPLGHVHGDLHVGNVMCLYQSQESRNRPMLIDFDTYQPENFTFFDLAYLEIDICLRLLPPTSTDVRRKWLDVASYLNHDLLLRQQPKLGQFASALNTLLRPIREAVTFVCKHSDAPQHLHASYWLARTAAGLSFARKRKVSSAQRLLALFLAAHSLRRVLEMYRIDWVDETKPFWVDWLRMQKIIEEKGIETPPPVSTIDPDPAVGHDDSTDISSMLKPPPPSPPPESYN
jgi:hypothetical protein